MADRPRKTIEVIPLRDQINARIKLTTSTQARRALCLVLESVLHASGNYRGFSYIDGWKGTEDWNHWYH